MIEECFTHCPGVGPETDRRLRLMGFNNWEQCISNQEGLPMGPERLSSFIMKLEESRDALRENDIAFFVKNFPPKEHWRLLAAWFEDAVFFDIETTGLSRYNSCCSAITAYRSGEMHYFMYGENLDGFLDLAAGSRLLVSFNGNCFDLPFLEKTFNLPAINCPHIDLRWVAYHSGLRGGLKTIEKGMNYTRPEEIADITGFEAVDLFYRWQGGDMRARKLLAGYCMVDTVSTMLIAERILKEKGVRVGCSDPHELFRRATGIASCTGIQNEPDSATVEAPESGLRRNDMYMAGARRRKIMELMSGAPVQGK